jgi:hypothetical protein
VKQTFIMAHDLARANAIRAVQEAPDGAMVQISECAKKREQEEKYHAMIRDISKQCEFMGGKLHADDWKRLLVDMFAKVMRDIGTPLHHDGRVIPSLDYERVVQLGIQTRDFWVREAADFIEYLYAFGAEKGVRFSAPDFY